MPLLNSFGLNNSWESGSNMPTLTELLSRPLAPSIDLNHKGSFTVVDSDIRGTWGDFTLSEDGSSIFITRFGRNGDEGDTYSKLNIGKYQLPSSYVVPTSVGEIPTTLTRLDLGVDMLGEEILYPEGHPNHGANSFYFEYVDIDIPSLRFRVLGLQEKDGKLILNHCNWYPASGLKPQTTFVFDSTDLSAHETAADPSTTVEDDFSMINLGHCLGHMFLVSDDWQEFFEGEIFSTAGQEAVTGQWSKGPSMTTFSSADLVSTSAPDDLVQIGNPPIMYYPSYTADIDGTLRGLYDTGQFTQTVIDSIGSNTTFHQQALTRNVGYPLPDGTISRNVLWNNASRVIASFIVPGTRTLAVFINMEGGTREPYYKDAPTQPFAYEQVLENGITTAVRDQDGELIPILDADGNKQPPLVGNIYKSDYWQYDPVAGDYFIQVPGGGDGISIADDRYLSILLFDTVDIQAIKDGTLKSYQLQPYYQKLTKQALDFTTGQNLHARAKCGDFNNSTGELFLSYRDEYQFSSFTFFPLFNVFDVTVGDGSGGTALGTGATFEDTPPNPTSRCNLRIDGINNGDHAIKLWSETDNTLIFNGDVSFINGLGSTPIINIPSGTAYFGRRLGTNPPTTGEGIYGVTV